MANDALIAHYTKIEKERMYALLDILKIGSKNHSLLLRLIEYTNKFNANVQLLEIYKSKEMVSEKLN